ncbi:hypothetical protein ASPWEDRAFT_171224 [Aspergillus wentii DTO 134E9]|uniref:ABC transporter domain-containing protein n=1 Tax=Aspergillus wentii DTO 134E9 TaxID=1073089 RepID=A0A1L9RS50_ASPWE|nr:uncharacterized protein ASPWEDRAFT_171224 [Aspergillus wentii DTO 134E9]KAI9930599.1 hypothetical protein MW887_011353 [Aspergillus wentii]OJJ37760.1 hypothetical protein ASPWEDRAFT_171224 [Aspergillus wentii DTO 134E9]
MFLRRPALSSIRFLRPSQSLRRARHDVSAPPPLIHIQDGTFYQTYPTPDDSSNGVNPPIFPNLNFVLPSEKSTSRSKKNAAQSWAVIGSSGKSDFLDILRGQYISIPPTSRSYPYLLSDEITQKDPSLRIVSNAIQSIGFSGEGSEAIGGTRGAYLSARYESHREETDWTVRQYLKGQTSLNPMEGEEDGKIHDTKLLNQVIANLKLEELLDMPVANLSNGQTRRARIAKALLGKPELLLIDDPFMGLDPATVRSISNLLKSLAEKSDPRLILALRPQDTIPDWIGHVMIIGHFNKILFQGKREDADMVMEVWTHLLKDTEFSSEKENAIFQQAKKDMEDGFMDRQLLWDLNLITPKSGTPYHTALTTGEPLIEMEGVRVQYGDKVVLGGWKQNVNQEEKEGLHWTVRRGQRWVVLGANGSGKTTLLSLITSDHPQTYAQPIKLFGRSRLPEVGKPGISIFELQSRIGHSSPEIHAFFPRQLTVRQSVESAFADTFLAKPKLNHEKDSDVDAVLRFFKAELDPDAAVSTQAKPPKITAVENFPKLARFHRNGAYVPPDYYVDYADSVKFGDLDVEKQRLVLFIRALVHKPDVIILDEAFSGMSASIRDKCLHFLEAGEHGRHRVSSVMRRTTNRDSWLKGFKQDTSNANFDGLTEDQALIMISHVKEELPDTVRFCMRLPSDPGDGSEPLDFRLNMLKSISAMSNPLTWDMAWTTPSDYAKRSKRLRGRSNRAQDNIDTTYEWHFL